KVMLLKPAEIHWVEAADNYANVHTASGEHVVRETLSSLEGRLPSELFLRISRSCIVNIDRVKEMQPTPHGEYTIILQDGTRLTLSRGYRENLARLRGEVR
ncbi:MAG TPA: LytTR family DNA-binding domain-containing protein, partial [Chthoniobacteraceae bacterium]|nr:LytTR family DNA-binding domain-containing protein [Chthoniobacteraceae bacterium]